MCLNVIRGNYEDCGRMTRNPEVGGREPHSRTRIQRGTIPVETADTAGKRPARASKRESGDAWTCIEA